MDLLIFDGLLNDVVVKSIMNNDFSAAKRKLIYFAEVEGFTDNIYKEYLVSIIANDDNVLSRILQWKKSIGESLYNTAFSDLNKIFNSIYSKLKFDYKPSYMTTSYCLNYSESIKALVNTDSEKMILDLLISHYANVGIGELAKYSAFKYNGNLEGIESRSKITFNDLIGLEYQKKILCDNTEAFIKGKRANNVLLFGDRGSGKSSSLKALLNQYCNQGLKIVEVPKHCITHIPELVNILSRKPGKYIIYLDDLSFENKESDYHALKIAMEGQIQELPINILIYVTSNRRHIIKETWNDREGEDIHINDNKHDTLSLSERFGINIHFASPSSQKEYLEIVKQMLECHNIDMTPEIEKSAIIWQMNNGSRSARCASQFVYNVLNIR